MNHLQNVVNPYRLDELPSESRVPVGWLALWSTLLISSPFIGFAIHGQVGDPGFRTGLMVATVPLLVLAYLVIRRWRVVRLTPRPILDQWRFGKVVPAEGAPMVPLPIRFKKNKYWIEIGLEGVVMSTNCFLRTQGTGDPFATSWVAHQLGKLFVSWKDIEEWIVDTDSDGPDYYRLKLRSRGEVHVRRFHPKESCECNLLDAIRNAGKLSVRLRCDVECA